MTGGRLRKLFGRAAPVSQSVSEAIEELKKFEQLEERDQQRERTAQEMAEQDLLDEVAARARGR